jgi:hypothetical protein
MLESLDLEKVLFLDIETVSARPTFDALNDDERHFWELKAAPMSEREGRTVAEIYDKAAIFAEFGKVVCISCGIFSQKNGEPVLNIKSYYDHTEKVLLQEFANMCDTFFRGPDYRLCAHNGKEFDFPYLCRRMMINGVKLPGALDIQGKKPWEIGHLDTMELWKFGDYKSFTSLNLLTFLFDIPTPKDDISGADVSRVYWQDGDLDRIVTYCQKDVVAMAQLIQRFRREPIIVPEQVIYK